MIRLKPCVKKYEKLKKKFDKKFEDELTRIGSEIIKTKKTPLEFFLKPNPWDKEPCLMVQKEPGDGPFYVASITKDGRLRLYNSLPPHFGLQLDENGSIVIIDEHDR